MIFQMRGISHLRVKAALATLVSSFQLECSAIEEVGVKQIGLLSFGFPGGYQPQTPIFIQTISTPSREAPAHLSRRQTYDAIASIRSTLEANSILASALLSTILLDGTSPIFCETNREK